MAMRSAGLGSAFLAAAVFLTGTAAQAQCPNNPGAGSVNLCLGDQSFLSTVPNGCCGYASANTAVGFRTLYANTTGAQNTAIGSFSLAYGNTTNWNTGVGYGSLMQNTGDGNTAVGARALEVSTSGGFMTALGYLTLANNSTGTENTAAGADALYTNTTGSMNAAFGYGALYSNQSGSYNTALGPSALTNLASGQYNLALGMYAGYWYSGGESHNIVLGHYGVAGESNVIRIGMPGTQTAAYIAGVYGATSSGGTWVMVNSAGQLGTPTSSLRFKEEVADMGASSADLMRLRPVTFRYKAPYDDGQRLLQYGLVAEEVAAVNPGLVQFGEDGKPLAVRYHFVDAMLLNEVQQQHSTIAGQAARIDRQAAELASQQAEIASQRALLAELAARLARLEAPR